MKKLFVLSIVVLILSSYFHFNDKYDLNASNDFFEFYNDDWKLIKIMVNKEDVLSHQEELVQFSEEYQRVNYNEYIYCDIHIVTSDSQTVIENVGFRLQGRSNRRPTLHENGEVEAVNYKLKFNEFEKGLRFADQDEMILKKVRHYTSFIEEFYSLNFLNEVGVTAPKATMVEVELYINDTVYDLGLYSAIEALGDEFLTKRYPTHTKGNLLYKEGIGQDIANISSDKDILEEFFGYAKWSDKVNYPFTLKNNKKLDNHDQIIELFESLYDYDNDELAKYLEENFEVDKLLKMLAVNYLVGNVDDYRSGSNNYYLYFNTNDKWEIIPHDYDNAIGQGWTNEEYWTWEDITNADFDKWPYFTWNSRIQQKPLSLKLLEIPKYQKQYIEYIKNFTDNDNFYFNIESFNDQLDIVRNNYSHLKELDKMNSNIQEKYIINKTKKVNFNLEKVQD